MYYFEGEASQLDNGTLYPPFSFFKLASKCDIPQNLDF